MVLKSACENPEEALQAAVAVLEQGGIVAYPTETLYGLGVKYDNRAALGKLYGLKRRPAEKAMPLIIGSREQLSLLAASVPAAAEDLMDRFWPGPLTLVLEARPGLPEHITSSGRVAVRVPGESFALRLAVRAGFPFTATSANISEQPPARSAAMILAYFDAGIDLVIDGGELNSALPSTVVEVAGGTVLILRKGAADLRFP
jgi:L-threonylcarbamoyladenylate synthase